MDYSTYWSILDTPSKTIGSNVICLFIAVGAGILWLLIKKFKKSSAEDDKPVLLWATAIFAIVGLAGYVMLTFFYPDMERERTLQMLNAPTTPKVEGLVSGFERIYRNSGRGTEIIEKFSVDTVRFAYGDALLGAFYSFSKTQNKVIFNGQRVRITYKLGSPYCIDCNSILRIEIAK